MERGKEKKEKAGREAELLSIGFSFDEDHKVFSSPHKTWFPTLEEINEFTNEQWPDIVKFYQKRGKFSLELFDLICEKISDSSKSTRLICQEFDIDRSNFLKWIAADERNKEYGGTLRDRYARAKEEQVEFMVDEIIEISDDTAEDVLRVKAVKNADGSFMDLVEENKEFVNRSKLRIDARKFIAAKLKPKKYGEKIDVTSAGEKITSAPATIVVEIVPPKEEE